MSLRYPKNEQETIMRFVQVAQAIEVEIQDIWSIYPDATIVYKGNNYKAEFEYKLSNFIKHRHNPSECDVVICWSHDLPNINFPLTVWVVSTGQFPDIKKSKKEVLDKFYAEYINKPKKVGRPSKYGDGKLFEGFFSKMKGENHE